MLSVISQEAVVWRSYRVGLMYKPPTNKQSYFAIVDAYWSDISHVLNVYLPTFHNVWIDGTKLNTTLGEYIVCLKETQSPRIARVFHAALWNIPEDVPNNEIPSFTQLYDLCVNEWCLIEEKEDDI